MSNIAEVALPVLMSDEAESKSSFLEGPLTALASVLSGYFILAAGSLYWLTATAGARRRPGFSALLDQTPATRLAHRLNGAYTCNSHPDGSGVLSRLLQPSRSSSRDQLVAVTWPPRPRLSPLHRAR